MMLSVYDQSQGHTSSQIVNIPKGRKSVAHLPEALKGIRSITLPNNSMEVQIERLDSFITEGSFWSETCIGNVSWIYNASDKTLLMSNAYLGKLSHWVKVGNPSTWLDPEKGIPTMQALKAMLVNALHLKGRVNFLTFFSQNKQTALEINLHLLQGDSLHQACSKSQSAYLAAELGGMIGGKVRLVHVDQVSTIQVTSQTIKEAFSGSSETFFSQKQFSDLSDLVKTGNQYSFIVNIGMKFAFIPDGVQC